MRVERSLVEAAFAEALRPVAARLRAGGADRVEVRVLNPSSTGLVAPHPFVCAEGMVFGSLRVDRYYAVARGQLTLCPAHTYEGFDEPCRRHPVVTPALLAAWRVGGPEAVESRYAARRDRRARRPEVDRAAPFRPRHRGAFDARVWAAWDSLVLLLGDRLYGLEDLPPMEHALDYLGVEVRGRRPVYSFTWQARR